MNKTKKAPENLYAKDLLNRVGLCDVVAGRMWFLCVGKKGHYETSYFWTKLELAQHIRKTQPDPDRRALLRTLYNIRGRTHAYAR